MVAYLVTVVVAGPDRDEAYRVASSVAEMAAVIAETGEGATTTHIADPCLVITDGTTE